MVLLALFNEGVRDHFTICGNFVRYFLWRGGFILFSLHVTMVWDLTNGAGILAPSDAIDVCVSKHQSALIGGMGMPAPPQGQRPEDLGHPADERKPLFV